MHCTTEAGTIWRLSARWCLPSSAPKLGQFVFVTGQRWEGAYITLQLRIGAGSFSMCSRSTRCRRRSDSRGAAAGCRRRRRRCRTVCGEFNRDRFNHFRLPPFLTQRNTRYLLRFWVCNAFGAPTRLQFLRRLSDSEAEALCRWLFPEERRCVCICASQV